MNQSGQQLGFQLAEQGAARAADHADRVSADWSDMALQAFRNYALGHAHFTNEDVVASATDLPAAPDKRAWGHIARKAARLGICTAADVGRSALPHAHSRWITIWQSNIVGAAA